MLKSLRRYAEDVARATPEPRAWGLETPPNSVCNEAQPRRPVVWKGTLAEYRSLLFVRQVELVLARANLTDREHVDWYTKNRILDLETKIADLKKWLAEAMEKQKGS